jgi:hypothetical protein
MPDADDYARAQTERHLKLFEWADRLLGSPG